MMYKKLAILNGSLLAVMIFLNGALAGRTGIYMSTLIYHLLGLLLLLLLAFIKKSKPDHIFKVPPLFLLPGVLSVMTIVLNNVTIPKLGVTLASGAALFGQLVMSALIEHFGLFRMQARRLKKEKIIGFLIISLGVTIMVLF